MLVGLMGRKMSPGARLVTKGSLSRSLLDAAAWRGVAASGARL